ncbi:MAG: SufD family Fe-S cluster assembly protein [Ruminococcus sp.]|nr:SufD family Fe-S cluster assembly protein [Ruminococcus sp.]
MSNENTLKLNKLPAPTFRYLKMNCAEAAEAAYTNYSPETGSLEGAEITEKGDVSSILTGCGEELSQLLSRCGIRTTEITAKASGAAAKFDLSFEGDKPPAARFEVKAPAGGDITVTQFIRSGESGRGAVQTLLRAEEGAKIHLIQVITCGADFELINDIGTDQQDRAAVEITQLYLSGRETIAGIRAGLEGYKAEYRSDIAYLLKQQEKLDLNLLASHKGRKTLTEINARGVLADTAQKIFRGTIDFLTGASGAKGAESEEVLMMNEKVVNKTVPLILCAEEDVEGSHGASIGKPDENHVFYMMSRGLSREEIYRIMARAKLDAVMRRIDDPRTLAEIEGAIGGAETDDQERIDSEG